MKNRILYLMWYAVMAFAVYSALFQANAIAAIFVYILNLAFVYLIFFEAKNLLDCHEALCHLEEQFPDTYERPNKEIYLCRVFLFCSIILMFWQGWIFSGLAWFLGYIYINGVAAIMDKEYSIYMCARAKKQSEIEAARTEEKNHE